MQTAELRTYLHLHVESTYLRDRKLFQLTFIKYSVSNFATVRRFGEVTASHPLLSYINKNGENMKPYRL
jgi:hypothetical protein